MQKSIVVAAYRHGFTRLGTNETTLMDTRRFKTKYISYYNTLTGHSYEITINISPLTGAIDFTETTNMSSSQWATAIGQLDIDFANYKSEFGSGEILSASKTVSIGGPFVRIWTVEVSNENTEDIGARLDTLIDDYAMGSLADVDEGKLRFIREAMPPYWQVTNHFDLPVVITGVFTNRFSATVSQSNFHDLSNFTVSGADEVTVYHTDSDWAGMAEDCVFSETEIAVHPIIAEQGASWPYSASTLSQQMFYATGKHMCVRWGGYQRTRADGGSYTDHAPICETGSGLIISPRPQFYLSGSESEIAADTLVWHYTGDVTNGASPLPDGDDCSCSLAP